VSRTCGGPRTLVEKPLFGSKSAAAKSWLTTRPATGIFDQNGFERLTELPPFGLLRTAFAFCRAHFCRSDSHVSDCMSAKSIDFAAGTWSQPLCEAVATSADSAACYRRSMFEDFSIRSKQIVFAARFKAGERGADMIDTDDLPVGMILEDQGLLENVFPSLGEGHGPLLNPAEPHTPFFSARVAGDLLGDLKKSVRQSQPVPLNREIPLSSSLARVFDAAKALAVRFRCGHVEPLHLLAAVVKENAGEGAKLLERSGITQERVLSALRPTENE
jgi:Clp amino terminal domain, pathogenicity island component